MFSQCKFLAGKDERSNHRVSLRQTLHRSMHTPSALAPCSVPQAVGTGSEVEDKIFTHGSRMFETIAFGIMGS
jgi:hypothetical protein